MSLRTNLERGLGTAMDLALTAAMVVYAFGGWALERAMGERTQNEDDWYESPRKNPRSATFRTADQYDPRTTNYS